MAEVVRTDKVMRWVDPGWEFAAIARVVVPLLALMAAACSSTDGAAFRIGTEDRRQHPQAGGSAGKGAGGAGPSTGGRVIRTAVPREWHRRQGRAGNGGPAVRRARALVVQR